MKKECHIIRFGFKGQNNLHKLTDSPLVHSVYHENLNPLFLRYCMMQNLAFVNQGTSGFL